MYVSVGVYVCMCVCMFVCMCVCNKNITASENHYADDIYEVVTQWISQKKEGRKEGFGFYVAFNSLGHIATR